MRPRNFKGGRCTKRKLKKCEGIAKTYDKIQTKYADILDRDENINSSGIGKSSAVSRAINILTEVPVLNLGNTNVIACLQVQAPADSSVKGLLLEILRKADEVLNTKYHSNAMKSHATTDMLIGAVSQVALNHIGLLVVDTVLVRY